MEETLSIRPPALESFGARMRWARDAKGYSQQFVAKFLAYPKHSRISQWETCRNFPSLDALVQVAGLYDVSIDWLIWGGDMAGGIDERLRKIPAILREGLLVRLMKDITETEKSAAKLPAAMLADTVKDSDERLHGWSAQNLKKKVMRKTDN